MAETCTGLPYGDDLNCTAGGLSPLYFTGKQCDTESGNDDFGARYYGSGAGRFMSSDWSSVPVAVPYADLTDPQTLNLYAIVRDNPETFADLDGHCGPDHVQDCKDNATTANGALAAACEGYPDPRKRGDGTSGSTTQQAQKQKQEQNREQTQLQKENEDYHRALQRREQQFRDQQAGPAVGSPEYVKQLANQVAAEATSGEKQILAPAAVLEGGGLLVAFAPEAAAAYEATNELMASNTGAVQFLQGAAAGATPAPAPYPRTPAGVAGYVAGKLIRMLGGHL
jgi:RHS repeat-associated protein